jgi:hypothetical protein
VDSGNLSVHHEDVAGALVAARIDDPAPGDQNVHAMPLEMRRINRQDYQDRQDEMKGCLWLGDRYNPENPVQCN